MPLVTEEGDLCRPSGVSKVFQEELTLGLEASGGIFMWMDKSEGGLRERIPGGGHSMYKGMQARV